MALKPTRKLLLAVSVAAALGCGTGNAFADSDRVEELEARVAELEALVGQLLNQQRQTAPAPKAEEIEARTEAVAEAKMNELIAEHKAAVAEKEHKHSYKFGGYVRMESMYSDYSDGSVASGSAGRDFYIPNTIPVGDDEGESYTDFTAKATRLNFQSNHQLENGSAIKTFIEVDFQLSEQGDERISNSFSPRLRHAFFTYDKWLFGQYWTTLFNVAALPETLDFIGPSESTIFGRQVQVRYSTGDWEFAAENPETTVTPYGGGRVVADDNQYPDFIARYNLGPVTIAGIARELAYVNKAEGIDDSTWGYGISLSGKHMIGEKDDFRWMASTGKGLGRYIGLNTANGAVLDADGNIEAIESFGIFGSYRHFWSEKWRSNLTVGYLSVDNDADLTGPDVTKNATSYHLNLIYSPVPRMDYGFGYMYADREVESGADGDMSRFQFIAKYSF